MYKSEEDYNKVVTENRPVKKSAFKKAFNIEDSESRLLTTSSTPSDPTPVKRLWRFVCLCGSEPRGLLDP